MNVEQDMKTGGVTCRDCGDASEYIERGKMDFSEFANDKRTEELNKIKREMEVGVEYDVENQTFINVQKQDLE